MSGSGWEIITITSGSSGSGSDATISVSLGHEQTGSTVFSSRVKLNDVEGTTHSNLFQRGNFDNFLIHFDDVSSEIIPTHVKMYHDGSDKWSGVRVYVMERSSGRMYSTIEREFSIDNKGEVSLPLSRCIKNPDSVTLPLEPKTSDFKVTVSTANVHNGGTDDLIYCKLISKDGFSSELHHFAHLLINDWKPGSVNNYRVTYQREMTKIDNVIFFKKAIDAWLPSYFKVDSNTLLPDPFPVTQATNVDNVWLNGDDVGRQNYIDLEAQ